MKHIKYLNKLKVIVLKQYERKKVQDDLSVGLESKEKSYI